MLIIGCSYQGGILLRGNGSFYAGWQCHCQVQCLIFDKGQRQALKLSLLILAFLILSLICVNIIYTELFFIFSFILTYDQIFVSSIAFTFQLELLELA